jgi:hypothetical protein
MCDQSVSFRLDGIVKPWKAKRRRPQAWKEIVKS